MAGIKVTDLPSIGTLEKTDITYIVDSSNDTSKQATIQNIIEAVDRVGLDDNDGNAVLQAVDSFGLKVKSDNAAFQGIYYNEDNSANYTDLSLIARQDAPRVYRIANTPCDEGLIPLAVGDIYIDTTNYDFYYSYATTDCSNWRKLAQTNGGGYSANLVSTALANQTIVFLGGIWNLAGNVVNCKTRVQLTMSPLHSYTFQISLPLDPSATFGIATQIQGSVTPFGQTTLWHKVNHTSVIAATSTSPMGNPCAEIFVEVDNSMNGLCQFVVDFSYEMF
jgi:hypothetical protein